MKATIGLGLALALAAGCARTHYAPSMRPNRASIVVDGAVYVYVHRAQVRAISLDPPFACDAQTVRLAREGAPADVEAEEIETFAFSTQRSSGVYRVRTVTGPELDLGPDVIVISGEDGDDPAVSAINIVNRYNDVAECMERWSK